MASESNFSFFEATAESLDQGSLPLTGAIAAFDVPEDFVEAKNLSSFFTTPLHRSFDDWSDGQQTDFEICASVSGYLKIFLDNNRKNFPKVLSYIGFESDAFCRYPAQYSTIFNEETRRERFKCEVDLSGFYNPKCRPWYKLQQEHLGATTLTDLYIDAQKNTLVASLCAAINDENGLYGVICLDIDMIQYFFVDQSEQNVLGPTIYREPAILQLGNTLAIEHLGQNLLRTDVLDL